MKALAAAKNLDDPCDGIGSALRLAFEVPPACPVIAAMLLRLTVTETGGPSDFPKHLDLETGASLDFYQIKEPQCR